MTSDLCLVIGSWSEVKESELLYPSPAQDGAQMKARTDRNV